MVSVIVPVYNAENYIHRCIDSILGQSYDNVELILVDDGSPDNCGAICDAYARKDARVHVIHQENQGVSAARNAGMKWVLENSKSQWVSFVDSDDWIHKDYLQILRTAVEKYNVKLAVCDMLWTGEQGGNVGLQSQDLSVMDAEYAFVHHHSKWLSVCCKLIHRSLLPGVQFPVGKRYEDAAVSHLFLFGTDRVAICSEKLYYYYCNQDSFTRSGWKEERLDVVDIHEQRLKFLADNGYKNAYSWEMEEYIDRLASTTLDLSDVMDCDSKYGTAFHSLRTKLRNAIQEAEQLCAFRFNKEHLMAYAFACQWDFVWRFAKLMQKIWRKMVGL